MNKLYDTFEELVAMARKKTLTRNPGSRSNKCQLCSSCTAYEVCGECIKCPLCGGPSINGERSEYKNIFGGPYKHFCLLHGECVKCSTGFFRKWQIVSPVGDEIELVEIGAFTHGIKWDPAEEPKQVEDILKRPPPPPSSVNLKRFRAIDSDTED
jgi:hypothetical protein